MQVNSKKTLLAHSADCFGCSQDNPAALGLQPRREGDEVWTDVTFDARHTGPPGLVHGGAIASACDELFVSLLHVADTLAVTRELRIEYLTPIPLGHTCRITAKIEEQHGRVLRFSARGRDSAGQCAFTALATFVEVKPQHFDHHTPNSDTSRASSTQ